jgi:hypothetical protein
MRYNAWVALAADDLRSCLLFDISQSGARIEIDEPAAVPDEFILYLSHSGSARRGCKVMWRKQRQLGVKFDRHIATQDATLVPKLEQGAMSTAAGEKTAAS